MQRRYTFTELVMMGNSKIVKQIYYYNMTCYKYKIGYILFLFVYYTYSFKNVSGQRLPSHLLYIIKSVIFESCVVRIVD